MRRLWLACIIHNPGLVHAPLLLHCQSMHCDQQLSTLTWSCRYTGHTLAKFIITMVSGVLTGIFAVALTSSVSALTEWKLHTVQSLLDASGSHRVFIAFLWHWAYSCALVVFAVALVSAGQAVGYHRRQVLQPFRLNRQGRLQKEARLHV